jgi:hypothetical protein
MVALATCLDGASILPLYISIHIMHTTRLVWDLVAALGCLRCLRGFWLQVTVLGPAGGVGLVDCLQLLHLPGYAIIPH